MADTGDLFRGCFLKHNGELVQVTEYEHRTPGNLRAFYQVKMKNVRTGKWAEDRFRAGESLEFVRVETKNFNVLYKEGESFVLMDNETFDQIYIPTHLFGDSANFIKEGVTVRVALDGENPVSAEGPNSIELMVTYTEPGIKGDTATKALKPATVETGATVMVPLFVNQDEMIRVNANTGEYLERVK
jgi:elongation factor P